MVETNIANSQPVSDEYLEKMNAYWRAANIWVLLSCICLITHCYVSR